MGKRRKYVARASCPTEKAGESNTVQDTDSTTLVTIGRLQPQRDPTEGVHGAACRLSRLVYWQWERPTSGDQCDDGPLLRRRRSRWLVEKATYSVRLSWRNTRQIWLLGLHKPYWIASQNVIAMDLVKYQRAFLLDYYSGARRFTRLLPKFDWKLPCFQTFRAELESALLSTDALCFNDCMPKSSEFDLSCFNEKNKTIYCTTN